MNLMLKIVNNPKETLTNMSHEFKEEGGSIGRDSSCSWVLHDKKEAISRIHANIEYKGGEYYLIDVSTNGMLYKQSNHLVPKAELVKLKESEVLCIGEYEILVGFVKGKAKKDFIAELLNQREIDVAVEESLMQNKEGNSALDVILDTKAQDKDILEYAGGGIKRAESINFDDAFGEPEVVDNNSVYTTHITAPTFQEEEEELKEPNGSDNFLLGVLSARLGINIEALSPTRQIELMNELADGLLLSLEASERLEENAKEIAAKLEKPSLKPSHQKKASGKVSLRAMVFNEQQAPIELSQKLKARFQAVQQQHTALYKASCEHNETLQHEFAPENLSKVFQRQSTPFSFISKDTENWRAYVTKYHHLNPSAISSNTEENFSKRLYVEYQEILETLKLSQGTN